MILTYIYDNIQIPSQQIDSFREKSQQINQLTQQIFH
jgi:hypothetical protein